MTTTKQTEGLIKIGEWGYTDSRGSGNWYAKPDDAAAVQAAYDAMDSDDTSPDVDAEIIAAGGVFVAE